MKKPFNDHVIDDTSRLTASGSIESADLKEFISVDGERELKPVDSMEEEREMFRGF